MPGTMPLVESVTWRDASAMPFGSSRMRTAASTGSKLSNGSPLTRHQHDIGARREQCSIVF